MRKLLLASAALMALPAVAALTPQSYPNYQVTSISPNGRFAASQYAGTVILMDLESGEEKVFMGNSEGSVVYSLGNGTPISNDGTMVGYIDEASGKVYYCENHKWIELKTLTEGMSNTANSITPDGRFICGGNGLTPISTDDQETPMSVPVLWVRGEDGKFGNPIQLPYPAKDLSGRIPQYVTALALSDDGSVILGQIRDYSGQIIYPIVYTNKDGEWSYSLPAMSLLNPENVELPEFPGDGPVSPAAESFLTPEEKAAYDKAMEEWQKKNEETGSIDYTTMPDAEDFLGTESKAEYEAAKAEFDKVNAEWNEKFIAFYSAFEKILKSGISFEFNNGAISSDGKTVWQTARRIVETGDELYPFKDNFAPATIDLTTGEVFIRDFEQNASMTYVAGDGTIFATKANQMEGLVYSPDVNTVQGIPFIDYVEGINPETATWVKTFMRHDLSGVDPVTNEPFDLKDAICSGYTICSRDLSVLISRAINYWDDTPVVIYSYVLPGKIGHSGITLSPAEEAAVTISKDGVISIDGDVVSLTVSDINGRVIYDGRPASGTIETGIGSGAYIIRTTGADGTATVSKVLL